MRSRDRVASIVAGIGAALLLAAGGTVPAHADTVVPPPVAGLTQPTNVTFSPDGARAYIANLNGTLAVIDTATNTLIGAALISGPGTGQTVVTPDSAFAYIAVGTSVRVLNTSTFGYVGAPIALTGNAGGLAISPDGSRVYVTVTGLDHVRVIDTTTNTLVGAPIGVAAAPAGIAMSPDGSRVYVTSAAAGVLTAIDTATDTVVPGTPFSTGIGSTPHAPVFSPDGDRLYVSTPGLNTITVIDPAQNTIIGTLPINAPAGLAITPDGTRLYAVMTGLDVVRVIDAVTGAVAPTTIPSGAASDEIAISPDGLKAYVTNTNANNATVIALDTAPTILTSTLPGGSLNVAYSSQIHTAGSPAPQVTVTSGSLPPGLTLNPVTGALTGTPQAPGTYTFDVTASATVSGLTLGVSRSYQIATPGSGGGGGGSGNGGSGGGSSLAATGFEGLIAGAALVTFLLIGGTIALIGAAAVHQRKGTTRR